MKRLLFVFNPYSGKAQIKSQLLGIVDTFIKAGYEVDIHPTQKKLDAKEQVLKKGHHYDLIVCSGGDGTLNEVVSGVMDIRKKPVVGYIPAGSTNDFAVSIKLPKKMLRAANIAVNGKIKEVDIGSFNDKYFTYIAAFGAFTDVPYMTPQEMKNVLGHQAYILEGIKRLSSLKQHHCVVEYEDQIIEDDFVFGMISNSDSVGGFKGITCQDVIMDDGLFEVTLIRPPRNPIELQQILSSLLGPGMRSDRILTFKTAELTFKPADELSWVLDGEYGGSPEVIKIKNNKKALQIMVEEEKVKKTRGKSNKEVG